MARGLSQILRMPPAEALRYIAPDDPRLDGALHIEQTPDEPITDEQIERERKRGLYQWHPDRTAMIRYYLSHRATADKRQLISGGTLASEARTELTLDGVTYKSVLSFYWALKVPEGEPRARFVAGTPWRELKVPRGRAGSSFTYGGEPITVGSLEHLRLIARAVSAKVAAHPAVRQELRATGRARLTMGADQPLGKVMPFALMLERLHLGR